MPKPCYQKESGAIIYKMTPAEKEIHRVNKQLRVVSKERDQLKNQVDQMSKDITNLHDKYEEIIKLLNK